MVGYIDPGEGSVVVQVLPVIAIVAVLGAIPATIASKKGRNPGLWWIYGMALFIVALIHALLLPDESGVRCPHCAEFVRPEARVCKHCGRDLTPDAITEAGG